MRRTLAWSYRDSQVVFAVVAETIATKVSQRGQLGHCGGTFLSKNLKNTHP